MYEVELKYAVPDLISLENRLKEMGAEIGGAITEVDLYFAHPARDFSQTDEALRLRRKGDQCFICYKGPKIDSETKTRHEIDLPLPQGEKTLASWNDILTALGFSPVAEVRKSRRKAKILRQNREVEGSLDQVLGVGNYFELELIAEEDGIPAAKKCLLELAAALDLHDSERRSYLELLLG